MTRDEAMQKAIKLLRLSSSDNPHEAALAAQRAQEILDRYEITHAMLEDPKGSAEPAEQIINSVDSQAPLEEFGVQVVMWKSYLSSVVAEANGCCVYASPVRYYPSLEMRTRFHLVGRPSDIEKVRYLYGYLVQETERLCRRQGKGRGRTWYNQFRLGVVDTIAQRLAEGRQELVAQLRRETQEQAKENPLALVRLEKAIAKVESKLADTQSWMAEHLDLRNEQRGGSVRSDPSARMQGRIAGDEIALTGARGAIE